MSIKIIDLENLIDEYGDKNIGSIIETMKGNKKYKCPDCKGTGTKKSVFRQGMLGWDTIYDYKKCELCNGFGYTEYQFKPKLIQDGWEVAI